MLVHVGVTTVFVAFEIIRRSFASQIAVNTLIIDVIFARNVFRILVCNVSHKISYIGAAIWQPHPAMAS